MKPNFTDLTDKELEEMRNALNTEVNRRKEELARGELAKLLDRVNELQYKYDFKISCEECDGSWISSVSGFQLSL